MEINELVAALLAAGGLGYINFAVAEHEGLIDVKPGNNVQVQYMLCWSGLDFVLYLVIKQIVAHLRWTIGYRVAITLSVTMFLVFILSVILMPLAHKAGDWLINTVRHTMHKATNTSESVLTNALGNGREMQVYIYTTEGKLIAAGEPELVTSDMRDPFELSLTPFVPRKDFDPWSMSYEDLVKLFSDETFQNANRVRQFIDFERGVIAVIVG